MSVFKILSNFVLVLSTLAIHSNGETDSTITLELAVDDSLQQDRFHEIVNGPKQDCCSLQLAGNTKSGIYIIYPYEDDIRRGVKVYCDLKTAGGGWTVIQERETVTGPIERFYRDWKSYGSGFGKPGYSHWLGLENIAALTSGYDQSIRFDMEDWEGQKRYALYQNFYIGSKEEKYKLNVGNYSGDSGDSFTYHNGNMFTTKDADNDINPTNNCAQEYKGGWWYGVCHESNLNGLYVVNGAHPTFAEGVNWKAFRGYYYALKTTEMKIRNRNFPEGCLSK